MSYEYSYGVTSGWSRKRRIFRRRVKKFVLFAILFLVIIFLWTIFFNSSRKTATIISPLADTFVGRSAQVISNIVNPSRLESVVTNSLKGTTGTYAVVIKNLKTGESYSLNADKKFTSASLYKLWVMATIFQQVETGKLSMDTMVKKDIATLNEDFDIASDAAELTDGAFNMSVKNALNQMITISHNYAALSLVQEVGLSNIANFLKQQGFVNSNVKSPPSTTAPDIALFFEKLYEGHFAGPESTKQMIELLKKQQINDRIPKYLPEGVEVAHKTGELDFVKHDAGIVFTEKGDYIIVVLSESKSPSGAADRIALLSKDIFEYFLTR
jgi:beta-lactamase class A